MRLKSKLHRSVGDSESKEWTFTPGKVRKFIRYHPVSLPSCHLRTISLYYFPSSETVDLRSVLPWPYSSVVGTPCKDPPSSYIKDQKIKVPLFYWGHRKGSGTCFFSHRTETTEVSMCIWDPRYTLRVVNTRVQKRKRHRTYTPTYPFTPTSCSPHNRW